MSGLESLVFGAASAVAVILVLIMAAFDASTIATYIRPDRRNPIPVREEHTDGDVRR